MDDYFNNTPKRITRLAGSFDCSLHFFRKRRDRATDRIRLNGFHRYRTAIDIGTQLVDLTNKADNFDAVLGPKPLLCDSAGCDSTDGLASAGSTTALPVSNAVFHLIG